MIAYKVVKLNDRGSAIVGVGDTKYYKIYNKGDIVKATENTLGLFCFKDLNDAIKFNCKNSNGCEVITVDIKGEYFTPTEICAYIYYFSIKNSSNMNAYYEKHIEATNRVPIGTICCQELKILD